MSKQPTMHEKSCSNCGSWKHPSNNDEPGECRAGPPVIGGWPKIKADDWCTSGWIKMVTPPHRSTSKTTVDFGQVGINYAYVRDYADDACTWLESVMENPEAIPAELQDMLQNPLAGKVTKPLPVLDACDQLIQWALAEPGGDNPALGDESGIFCYLDSQEERDRNMAILASLGDDHTWVHACRQVAQPAPARGEAR